MAIVLNHGKHTIGRPREKLAIRLAEFNGELGKVRQCFAPEDSSSSGGCAIEV
jgi:hypothetical protein